MAIARDPKRTWWYQLKADRVLVPQLPDVLGNLPEPKMGIDSNGTQFKLRTLTQGEMSSVMDHAMREKLLPTFGTPALMTVRAGLAGWIRMHDSNGTEVAFEEAGGTARRTCPEQNIERLAFEDIQELAQALQDGSAVSVPVGN